MKLCVNRDGILIIRGGGIPSKRVGNISGCLLKVLHHCEVWDGLDFCFSIDGEYIG